MVARELQKGGIGRELEVVVWDTIAAIVDYYFGFCA